MPIHVSQKSIGDPLHTYMLNVCDFTQVTFLWKLKHAFNKILMEDFMKISTKWLYYKTGVMTGYQCW